MQYPHISSLKKALTQSRCIQLQIGYGLALRGWQLTPWTLLLEGTLFPHCLKQCVLSEAANPTMIAWQGALIQRMSIRQHRIRACVLTCSTSWRNKESSNKNCQWLRSRKTTQMGTKFEQEIKRWTFSKGKGIFRKYLQLVGSQKEPQRFVRP